MRTKALKKLESDDAKDRQASIVETYALCKRKDRWVKPTPAYKSKIEEHKNMKRSQSGPSNVTDRPKKDEKIMDNKIRQINNKIDASQDGIVHCEEQSIQNTMRPAVTNLDYIYCTGCKFMPVAISDDNAPMIHDKDGKEIKQKLYAIKASFQFSF